MVALCLTLSMRGREREMFYLTTHSTHFIYGYMAILIVRKETRCRHIGYSYRLTARVLLYAPSHIQDDTYHGLCYTSRGALAGTRNSSMGPRHEGSIRRPTSAFRCIVTTRKVVHQLINKLFILSEQVMGADNDTNIKHTRHHDMMMIMIFL